MCYMTQTWYLALIFCVANCQTVNVSTPLRQIKPYRMRILSLNLFTGYEPRDNQLCKAAQQMVADIINNRTDLLPDYHIELDFQNEGPTSVMAVRMALEYVRRMERETEVYQSPVSMGPFLTPGCRGWGTTSRYVNMVVVTASCASPIQTARRDLYPNMWRSKGPAETTAYARAYFLARVAKINKVAIMFHSSNPDYNYQMARLFYKASSSTGIDVLDFETISEFSADTMAHLKKDEVRVFTIDSGEPIGGYTFLCQAYYAGIRGPRYVFVFALSFYIDVKAMPLQYYPGCTREIIAEQFKRIVFLETPTDAPKAPPNRTRLGHTMADFEEMFARYTNGLRTADFDFRHMGYDRMLETAVILDNTEQALKTQNLSLRDYRTNPELIMTVANKSAANVDFQSLRFGRFQYSARLEFEQETQLVAVWVPEKGLVYTHLIACRENASATNVSSYYVVQYQPLPWQLPKDSPFYVEEIRGIPLPGFGIVTAFASALALGEMATAVKAFTSSKISGTPVVKCLMLMACLILDAAAISFAVSNDIAICYLQVAFLSLGISLIHTAMACRLFVAYRKAPRGMAPYRQSMSSNVRPATIMTSSSTSSVNQSTISGAAPDTTTLQPQEKQKIVTVILQHAMVNAVVIVAWFVANPFSLAKSTMPVPEYYNDIDTYVTVSGFSCDSENRMSWIGALLGWNAVPLLFGIYMALKLRQHATAMKVDASIKVYLLCVILAVSLFVCVIAIVFTLSNEVGQLLAVSFGSLLYSLSIAGIIFYRITKGDAASNWPAKTQAGLNCATIVRKA